MILAGFESSHPPLEGMTASGGTFVSDRVRGGLQSYRCAAGESGEWPYGPGEGTLWEWDGLFCFQLDELPSSYVVVARFTGRSDTDTVPDWAYPAGSPTPPPYDLGLSGSDGGIQAGVWYDWMELRVTSDGRLQVWNSHQGTWASQTATGAVTADAWHAVRISTVQSADSGRLTIDLDVDLRRDDGTRAEQTDLNTGGIPPWAPSRSNYLQGFDEWKIKFGSVAGDALTAWLDDVRLRTQQGDAGDYRDHHELTFVDPWVAPMIGLLTAVSDVDTGSFTPTPLAPVLSSIPPSGSVSTTEEVDALEILTVAWDTVVPADHQIVGLASLTSLSGGHVMIPTVYGDQWSAVRSHGGGPIGDGVIWEMVAIYDGEDGLGQRSQYRTPRAYGAHLRLARAVEYEGGGTQSVAFAAVVVEYLPAEGVVYDPYPQAIEPAGLDTEAEAFDPVVTLGAEPGEILSLDPAVPATVDAPHKGQGWVEITEGGVTLRGQFWLDDATWLTLLDLGLIPEAIPANEETITVAIDAVDPARVIELVTALGELWPVSESLYSGDNPRDPAVFAEQYLRFVDAEYAPIEERPGRPPPDPPNEPDPNTGGPPPNLEEGFAGGVVRETPPPTLRPPIT